MKECSKSIYRRLASPCFARRYFVGEGIDVGGGSDPLSLYVELFPLLRSVRTWDLGDGDAQLLAGVENEAYDFVHSSHCLEHLTDPYEALANWHRVVRPNGYLVVTVPDEDLYEQGIFPSTFNRDHKWTFTIHKERSWSTRSINVIDLVRGLGGDSELVRLELLSATYRFDLPRYDQSLTPAGECGIEFVLRKRSREEVARGGGGRPGQADQPDREIRVHLNQYRNDWRELGRLNQIRKPFSDDDYL